ncbi:MAG: nuclear transport factor 2 family protein [Candidatus Aminicenantes bacterium]|nr:nuclear transport factor 2 family protein [Candidatus Aminicenantes bacterium]
MMRRMAMPASIFLVAAGIGLGARIDRTQEGPADFARNLTSLVEAEKAFSKASEDRGIREAFLTWLAPDAVVFRPSPVPGRPVYEKMDPANPAVLTWEPEFAEIAASGELGYTTGPYEIRASRDAEPAGFGHYVSVWKKQPDGSWKVFLDIGVEHGRPAASAGTKTVVSPAISALSEPIPPEALRDVEYAFGIYAGAFDKEVGNKGLPKALTAFATGDIRVYRAGQFPAIGLTAAKALIPGDEGKVGRTGRGAGSTKTSYKVGISWSGDLAYSYGTIGSGKPGGLGEATAFLRIWRRNAAGLYDICLDIRLPIPPKTAN